MVFYLLAIPTIAVAAAVLAVAPRAGLTTAQKAIIGLMAALVGIVLSALVAYTLGSLTAPPAEHGFVPVPRHHVVATAATNAVAVMITGYLLSLARWAHGWFGFGDRFYLPRSPKELVSEVEDKTEIQIKDITRRYKGTWLQVRVKITEVSAVDASFNLIYLVQGQEPTGVHIVMRFNAVRWARRLRTMNRGDNVTVRGVIQQIRQDDIWLTACEIAPEESGRLSSTT